MLGDRKLSIVIPVYNEVDSLDLLYRQLLAMLGEENFEVIFIDDGSRDGSAEKVKSFARENKKVRVIGFSRNFGKELAITAGINNCSGDVCIVMDADLQHPLELIPAFIKKWQEGAEVVVGVREGNKGEGLTKRIGSFLFYRINSLIGDIKMVPHATDFRLLDRKVIDEFNRFTEKNRISRGLVDWLGFRTDYVYFTANPRRFGKPTYGFLKLIKLAFSTFVSHSLFPLKIAGYLGMIITLFSGGLGVFIITEQYILNDPWRLNFTGPAMLAILILFLIGIVLICIGFIALYVGNIHNEILNRPLYIVREKVNFEK